MEHTTYCLTKSVRFEGVDPLTKQSLGTETHVEVNLKGHVLGLVEKEVAGVMSVTVQDVWDRDYIAMIVEIEPGYDKFVQSASPAVQASLLAANRGDYVRIKGVLKRSSKGGANIRIQEYEVLEAAPKPFDPEGIALVTDVPTEAVAA